MTFHSAQSLKQSRSQHAPGGAGGRRPRVVIVGAGFAGLSAAKRLAKAPVDITLIDREDHHLFQPLLYQVATAGLSPADIAWPIRSLVRGQHNARVLLGAVTGVDCVRKRVIMAHRNIAYDVLVLATGATHGYFGHDSWAAHAPGLKTIDDATEMRRRLLLAFERAEMESDARERERLLTIVIVGGGPTGIEMAGAVVELARKALAADFRAIDPKQTHLLLVETGPRLLQSFPEPLSRHAEQALRRVGVDVRLQQAVTHCSATGVSLGEESVSAGTVIWAAGIAASPAVDWLAVAGDRVGRVLVGPDLRPPGMDDVFVIGDTALAHDFAGRPTSRHRPGRQAAGRLCGRSHQGEPRRQARAATVSLSGPRPARHGRPQDSRHRVRAPAAQGMVSVVDLGHRSHLLFDQPAQSADRHDAVALVLCQLRAWCPAHHRHPPQI
jgi:NADH dehydrogenase